MDTTVIAAEHDGTHLAPRDRYQHLRRTLLTSEQLRTLNQRQPWRLARDLVISWASIIAALLVADTADRVWVTVLAAAFVGNRFYGLLIIGHDGLHRRLVAGTARNDMVNDLLVMAPIASVTRLNNRNHLHHHQSLGTDADPDRYKHVCVNKSTPLRLVGHTTGATTALKSARNVFGRGGDTATAPDRKPRGGYRARDLAMLAGWQTALLVILTWRFGWWGFIGMWWLPVFCFTFLADNLRAFIEHSHLEPDDEADTHRLITHLPPWPERQLLSPMHMNYHAAHHLWPSIPYYNLPAADALMMKAPGSEAIEIRGSYLRYLWQFLRTMPVEGCEPARLTHA